jgi:DUF4097 and DUF4098 domain-containing protein YvlB
MIALALLVMAVQQAAPLDTTIAVQRDTRLEVSTSAGSIDVKTWERAAVRIVAKPSRGAVVSATLDGAVLRVTARSPQGRIDLVDYEITVPRRMDLKLGWSGGDVDITVHESEGAVEARNSSGTITISGGVGTILAESINGPVVIRHARGRVSARSGNGPVAVDSSSGDLDAESTTHHVTLTAIESHNLRAASVGGVVRFSGPVFPDGRYDLSSHSGSVWIKTPLPLDATVSVATVNGAFTTALPHDVVERRRRGIFTARFGDGRAQVSLESFNGAIVIEQM